MNTEAAIRYREYRNPAVMLERFSRLLPYGAKKSRENAAMLKEANNSKEQAVKALLKKAGRKMPC